MSELIKNEEQDSFLKKLKISQNFQEKIGVEQKIVSIQIRKPKKQEFVTIHPSPEYRADLALLTNEEDRETYVLDPSLLGQVPEAHLARVALAMNRQSTLFMWCTKLPSSDGKILEWHRTGLIAMDEASRGWVKVVANMNAGAYDISTPQVELPKPIWPKESFSELLKITLRNRLIDDLDHLVLKKIRGEA